MISLAKKPEPQPSSTTFFPLIKGFKISKAVFNLKIRVLLVLFTNFSKKL